MSRASAVRSLASALALVIGALGGLPPEHIHDHASPSPPAATVHRHFTPHAHHSKPSLHDADQDDPRAVQQAFVPEPVVRLTPAATASEIASFARADETRGLVRFTPALGLVHGPPGSSAAFRAPPFSPAI